MTLREAEEVLDQIKWAFDQAMQADLEKRYKESNEWKAIYRELRRQFNEFIGDSDVFTGDTEL